eukprot:12920951-Prorocentrum_lima.AAC.1
MDRGLPSSHPKHSPQLVIRLAILALVRVIDPSIVKRVEVVLNIPSQEILYILQVLLDRRHQLD